MLRVEKLEVISDLTKNSASILQTLLEAKSIFCKKGYM